MALSNNVNRITKYRESHGEETSATVKAANTVYNGAFVLVDPAGTATITTGNLPILGIANKYAEAGEVVTCDIGHWEQLTLSGATAGDVGKLLYSTADNVFTLTVGTNPVVGRIRKFITTDTVMVAVGVY